MGLDTTHNCYHGSYGGFNRWRNALARAAGYQILPVKYDDGTIMDCIMLDWGHLPPGHLDGEWDEIPSDPLLILLTHQDCDGRIKSEHCAALADALESVLPRMDENDGGLWLSSAEMTRGFITGLYAAAIAGEDVGFH